MSPIELEDVAKKVDNLIIAHKEIISTLFDMGLTQEAREFAKALNMIQEANENLKAAIIKWRSVGL